MPETTTTLTIPDLPPDISFIRLAPTEEAFEFAFTLKREAMGPHIIARWGWDEAFQRDFHKQRFRERCFYRIVKAEISIGSLALTHKGDYILFDDYYLFPEHQRQGLGSRILKHCLSVADGLGVPVHLRYLKWNPVGSLYRRHGFEEIGQSDIHFLMARPPLLS